MPPEKSAYALARYSRSPDSIRDSIEWVRTHDSQKFLESFYFQYGHASIADLGHTVVCFEGISELAATEIEEEPLWDGQAKSSRYQDFSKSGFVTPAELASDDAALFQRAALLLTPEGGAAHLAATTHTPAVVLWSEGPFDKWRSRSKDHSFVRLEGDEKMLSVERVWQAIEAALIAEKR